MVVGFNPNFYDDVEYSYDMVNTDLMNNCEEVMDFCSSFMEKRWFMFSLMAPLCRDYAAQLDHAWINENFENRTSYYHPLMSMFCCLQYQMYGCRPLQRALQLGNRMMYNEYNRFAGWFEFEDNEFLIANDSDMDSSSEELNEDSYDDYIKTLFGEDGQLYYPYETRENGLYDMPSEGTACFFFALLGMFDFRWVENPCKFVRDMLDLYNWTYPYGITATEARVVCEGMGIKMYKYEDDLPPDLKYAVYVKTGPWHKHAYVYMGYYKRIRIEPDDSPCDIIRRMQITPTFTTPMEAMHFVSRVTKSGLFDETTVIVSLHQTQAIDDFIFHKLMALVDNKRPDLHSIECQTE